MGHYLYELRFNSVLAQVTEINMQIICLFALVAFASASYIAPASHLARVPSHDSAVIQSHRLGGNFAYRTDEAHAYASVHPVVTPVQVPVAETYHAPIAYHTPISYETKHHTETVEVPVHKTYATYTAPKVHTYAAPAPVAYAAPAPVAYAAPAHAYGAYAAPAYHGYAPLAYHGAAVVPAVEEVVEEA